MGELTILFDIINLLGLANRRPFADGVGRGALHLVRRHNYAKTRISIRSCGNTQKATDETRFVDKLNGEQR